MYKYKAKLIKIIDGDTLDAMIDLGFNIWIKKRIRLANINAFECRTRDKEVKKKGLKAKEALAEVLLQSENEFLLTSEGVGKYGRCLGIIQTLNCYIKTSKYHGKSINDFLLKEGHAKKYIP
tara:strand:- start:4556 stop:4921 length:366 start_codon:yes stop_codon:yes gene_type:complete